jgi:hypothetical protein
MLLDECRELRALATLLKACRERVLAVEQRLAAGLDAKAETAIRRWLAKVAAKLAG